MEALDAYANPYPGGVAKIWLARDPGHDLQDAYDRRQKAGKKLEKGILKIIKLAVKLVKKRKLPPGGRVNAEQQNSTSVTSRYILEKQRPKQRLGKLPCIGTKVDTIQHNTEELRVTNALLQDGRSRSETDYQVKSSAFIMFNDQLSSHEFAQNLKENLPLRMRLTGRFINAAPDDIIWKNLNVKPASNKIRKLISWAITIATIIFW